MSDPRTVALGGGHGLSATLRALRAVSDDLTAVVTVGDDGGSSGVLRRELGLLPVGDLRMALAALGGSEPRARMWSELVQHRFDAGTFAGHPVGNLILAALLQTSRDPVAALAAMADLIGAQGRVLPMAEEPVDIVADLVTDDGGRSVAVGQVAVASSPGRVASVRLEPGAPAVCETAVEAVQAADLVVLGPGSWFTSVVPHLLVPQIRDALVTTGAVRVLTLNLAPQPGETHGFSAVDHVEVLLSYAPDIRFDAVIADASLADDRLAEAAAALGAELVQGPLVRTGDPHRHSTIALASAYARAWERGRITASGPAGRIRP